jgi:hypothetical protein
MGYYHVWHQRSPRNFYFAECLFSDLTNFFFQLDSDRLNVLFDNYKEEYGENAYQYALKSYPKWKLHIINPSRSTISRLVGILPPLLSTEQRITLLQKLLERELRPVQSEYSSKSINTDWDNYRACFVSLTKQIESNQKRFCIHKKECSDKILKTMDWLFEDDMVLAQDILIKNMKQIADFKFQNAIYQARDYLRKCDELYQNERFYDSVSFSLETPSARFDIIIEPKKKPFGKKIHDFFL